MVDFGLERRVDINQIASELHVLEMRAKLHSRSVGPPPRDFPRISPRTGTGNVSLRVLRKSDDDKDLLVPAYRVA